MFNECRSATQHRDTTIPYTLKVRKFGGSLGVILLNFAFGARCDQAGVRPSTGSVGDCYDNAMAVSFFATLEMELIDRHWFKNKTEARMAILYYIEGFYNVRRRHSSIGTVSPLTFENRYHESTENTKRTTVR